MKWLIKLWHKLTGGSKMTKPKKKRARFNIDIAQNRKKEWYIVLKAANGRTFNHRYNTKAKAKQSANSLARSFKQGHLDKKYE